MTRDRQLYDADAPLTGTAPDRTLDSVRHIDPNPGDTAMADPQPPVQPPPQLPPAAPPAPPLDEAKGKGQPRSGDMIVYRAFVNGPGTADYPAKVRAAKNKGKALLLDLDVFHPAGIQVRENVPQLGGDTTSNCWLVPAPPEKPAKS